MKLNLGCGPNKLDGYVGCDIIDHPGVDYVCSVDSLPFDDELVDEVLCEHIIEHLTFEQANRALVEWFRVLKVGGDLVIECPDLLGICKQFVESNEFGRYTSHNGRWPLICHLYGHQRGNSEDEKFSQIHKSGYTFEHLQYVLTGIGFEDFRAEEPVHGGDYTPVMRIRAKKAMSVKHTIHFPEIF